MNLSTILTRCLSTNSTCSRESVTPLSTVVSRCFATKKEISFSQSPAFSGQNVAPQKPLYTPSYFDSQDFHIKRLFSAVLSCVAVGVYIAFFREPNDLDELLNAPKSLVGTNMERSMLREQIKRERKSGKPTQLLEAELSFIDVKEKALRNKYQEGVKD